MATTKKTYAEKDVYGYVQFKDADDFKVTISTDTKSKAPATVSVNFKVYALPRGKEIIVKEPIVHALNDAVRKIYSLDEGVESETLVHTYQFSAMKVE